jgi:hypothetical protein
VEPRVPEKHSGLMPIALLCKIAECTTASSLFWPLLLGEEQERWLEETVGAICQQCPPHPP